MYGMIDRLIGKVEQALAVVAAMMAFFIMVIIVADVFLRYFLHMPFSWATELIGWFLMVILFYGALSGAFTNNSHVRVDILREYFSVTLQRLCEGIVCLVSALPFGVMAVLAADRSWLSWSNDEVLSGLIAWPTWPPPAFAAIGAALLTVRLLVNGTAHLAAAATGHELIRLPARSGEHAEAGGMAE